MSASELSTPPDHPVPWLVSHAATHQCTTIVAQWWFDARREGAAVLGVPLEEVEVQLEEDV